MLLPSKPFTVSFGDLRLRFEPDHENGGYLVRALNREGVFSQGATFEEALEMVLDAEHLVAEYKAGRKRKHHSRELAGVEE